jgi:hypothetical protein
MYNAVKTDYILNIALTELVRSHSEKNATMLL